MKTALVKVQTGEKIRLKNIDASATGDYGSKEETLERLQSLQRRMAQLQEALYAEDRRSLLVVFQATDTGGKDGALKSVMAGVNPAGVQVTSFKTPTSQELEHDFLWRAHKAVPPRGTIGVWNRSHYEDVLIVRVHDMVEKKVWRARYDDINNFDGSQVLPAHLQRRAESALAGAPGRSRKELEVQRGRPARTRPVERLPGGV
jgi:polyphosphate kinase 2 (PPK2 family)